MSIETSKACNDSKINTIITDNNANNTPDNNNNNNNNNKTPNERELDNVLHELQKATDIKIFESKEMAEKRKNIILEVEHLTTLWIRQCLTENQSVIASEIEKCSSYICSFGSYELNVHFESSDIDLLCIGPKHITRDMLFKEFVEILASDKRVSDILVLRHAFVPLLKFTFEGIDIDLVYAQWDIDIINKNINKHEQINVFSRGFISDQDTLFSLNGVRSTQTIKKLVPNKCIFEKSLRIIKFWAQQRAIYGNVMGFLGGISWSIMTAKICIQNPDLCSCVEILKQFFIQYQNYNYTYDSINLDPKLYDDMYDIRQEHKNNTPYPYHEGVTHNDSLFEYQRNEYTEIMPILTPARPAMNCAYNVIESTKEIITQEIQRGYDIITNNNQNNNNNDNEHIDWIGLFSKRHLLQDIKKNDHMYNDYENVFIRIQCVPDNKNLFGKKWTGFIESKLRNLVKKLNRELFDSTFYPYANSIKYRNIDNFFISGKYNVDYDHRANNEDTINIALQGFQTQIDMSSVRYACGLKCQLKLDVLNINEMHNILSNYNIHTHTILSNKGPIQPIINKTCTTTTQIVYPQYNILQQIQLMNIAQQPQPPAVQVQPPQPQTQPHPHPYTYNRKYNGNNHNNHNNNQNQNNNKQPIFPNLNPTPIQKQPVSLHNNSNHNNNNNTNNNNTNNNQNNNTVNAATESVVKSLTPKVMENTNNNNMSTECDSDTNSNESAQSNSTRSNSIHSNSIGTDNGNSVSSNNTQNDSITVTPQSQSQSQSQANNNQNQNQNRNQNISQSFQVPNISNLSFPIIKIQQQPLPHLPPFVTTQNGPSHYPLQNGNNIMNHVKYIPPHIHNRIHTPHTHYNNNMNNINNMNHIGNHIGNIINITPPNPYFAYPYPYPMPIHIPMAQAMPPQKYYIILPCQNGNNSHTQM